MLEKTRYLVSQKKEMVEFFGFEGRNKYRVTDETGQLVLYVAEQGKTLMGALARQFFGHRQRLNLFVFNSQREKVLEFRHPFNFFFQRLHLHDAQGELIGKCVHRFGFFRRRLDILDAQDTVILEIRTPLAFFLQWNYPIWRNDRKVAEINKKFSGVFQEMFTDADNFQLSFDDPTLTPNHRALIFSSAILIDLLFFETKAGEH